MKTTITFFVLLIAGSLLAQSEFHIEETHPISPSGTLHLDTEDADITITANNRSDVYVKVDRKRTVSGIAGRHYDRFDFKITSREGDLYLEEVSESNMTFVLGAVREKYTIRLEIPKGVSLNLEGEDDDYVLENISGAIALDVEDGDTEIKNYQGNHFDYRAEDGDLYMDGGTGEIRIEAEDGDVIIEQGNFHDIDLDVEDGDVIFMTDLHSNGTYLFKSEDGDMELLFTSGGGTIQVRHDDGHVRTTKKYRITEETDHKTVVYSDEGKSEVRVRTEDGSIHIGH